MARENFVVRGGPLNGEDYALDLDEGDEIAFNVNGQAHVYRAGAPAFGVNRLDYVGIDPTIDGSASYR